MTQNIYGWCGKILKVNFTDPVESVFMNPEVIIPREWEDKEGNKRQTTEVVAQTVQFLGGRGEGPPRPSAAPPTQASGGSSSGPSPDGDDIPF